ncbi:MAG: formate dehydrogenase accessory sulfurtransferase FdhD [Armatimonadota bacterium]|nr:formate dehydrogenase accessory sulfurtransferase FdhD [Armatimonadota bacterium]
MRHGLTTEADDCLVVEEPLEIRIDGHRFTATMRTPGHDLELARGLLLTEGVIQSNDDIEDISARTRCRDHTDELVNVVNVTLHDGASAPAHGWERSLISNSSCGLCGKASIEALTAKVQPVPRYDPVPCETLLHLPHVMRQKQQLFQQTGGLHAAGIFDAQGNCRALFEDIGRHNATDKAIGYGLEQGWLPWRGHPEPLVLLVSGRASFEIVQKALVARIPILCAVSAASALAVELAAANNQTLIGFLRDAGLTIYTAPVDNENNP